MQIIPRIYFSGSCREAIELYKAAFNATVDNMMTFGQVKMGTEEQKDLIVNSQLSLDGNKLHLADNINMMLEKGNQLSLTVVMSNPDEVKSAFEKLKTEGRVIMEPAPSFFSPCHCAVTDEFGVTWQINC